MVNIKHVYDRLKENYGDLEIELCDWDIKLRVAEHTINANVSRAELEKDGETILELPASSSDELYVQIEKLITLANSGGASALLDESDREGLNPTYKAAVKSFRRWELWISIPYVLLAIYWIFHSTQKTDLLMCLSVPVVIVLSIFIQKKVYRTKWVCPKCTAALPTKKNGLVQILVYAKCCPHCGENLETVETEVNIYWQKHYISQVLNRKIQWSEADELPMHGNIKAVRRGLIFLSVLLAMSILASACVTLGVLPRPDNVKIRLAVAYYLPLLLSTGLLVYFFVFAPMFIAGRKPKEATDEWKKKHIHFPAVFLLLALCYAAIFTAAKYNKITPVNSIWLYIMCGLVTAALCAAFILRIPKRLRGIGNTTTILVFVLLAFSIIAVHELNYSLIKETSQYQAEVVDARGVLYKNDRVKYYVTVLLDDGRSVKIETSEEMCQEAMRGETIGIIQTETYLGVTAVSIAEG